jgi:hypothetical protein
MEKKSKFASTSSKDRAKQFKTQRNPVKGAAMKTRKATPVVPDAFEDRNEQPFQIQYQRLFTSFPLPHNGLYTDDDNLEQPSPLKYVPTTSTPSTVS